MPPSWAIVGGGEYGGAGGGAYLDPIGEEYSAEEHSGEQAYGDETECGEAQRRLTSPSGYGGAYGEGYGEGRVEGYEGRLALPPPQLGVWPSPITGGEAAARLSAPPVLPQPCVGAVGGEEPSARGRPGFIEEGSPLSADAGDNDEPRAPWDGMRGSGVVLATPPGAVVSAGFRGVLRVKPTQPTACEGAGDQHRIEAAYRV